MGQECVGAIVCKLDMHKKMFRRGYIAMLAVDSKHRRKSIGEIRLCLAQNKQKDCLYKLEQNPSCTTAFFILCLIIKSLHANRRFDKFETTE